MNNVEIILDGLAALPELENVELRVVPDVPDVEMSAAEILALLGPWQEAMSKRMAMQHWGAGIVDRLWYLRPIPLPGVVVGL